MPDRKDLVTGFIFSALSAAAIAFIFSNSLQPAAVSGALSGGLLEKVNAFLSGAGLPAISEKLLRKTAHLCEFGLLFGRCASPHPPPCRRHGLYRFVCRLRPHRDLGRDHSVFCPRARLPCHRYAHRCLRRGARNTSVRCRCAARAQTPQTHAKLTRPRVFTVFTLFRTIFLHYSAKKSKKNLTNICFTVYNGLPLEKGFFKCAVSDAKIRRGSAHISESKRKRGAFRVCSN